jgi:DNA repair protein RecN (Recombination protein N)
MLRFLSLRDFVIVDTLELEFHGGFTALTGETGAGKSILVDALALVLGARADQPVVRRGAGKAEISAEFDLDPVPAARGWLVENDLAEDGACLLRRVIDDANRSRAYINGRSATLTQLRELGDLLLDIHGQHEHQKLTSREAQRELLDSFAGASAQTAEVGKLYEQWQGLAAARRMREADAAGAAREREELEWQLRELEALAFTEQGWEVLQSDHARLANAASLIEAAQAGLAALEDDESAALGGVDAVAAQLGRAAQVDAALKPALDMVESASVNLREAVHHLRQYLERVEVDPARLAEADRRLSAIHDMARKYRVDPSRIGELIAQKQARLGALGGENSLDELRTREAKAESDYTQSAQKLSKLRTKGAKKFAADVSATMQTLAMEGGRLEVVLTPCEPAAHGLEQCEYLVAAHEGQPSGPLARIASGGELSRISLAIQVLASTRAGVPTLIFDEVDSGIGGRVAEIVGRLLKQLAASRQVMCVTHLPQVAACADQQLRVAKEPAENGVVSRIDALKGAARVEEIARMLGGIQITAATRKHAEEMLSHARSQSAAVST